MSGNEGLSYANSHRLIIDQLSSGSFLLTRAVEDFDDREFHVRLPGRGESANWIFGHLAINEDWFLHVLTGSNQEVSASLRDKYFADESPPADPGTEIVGRDEILDLFLGNRQRVISALEKEDPSNWDGSPPVGLPPIFETLGSVWGILGTHQYWHLGQIMTIRQMLAKPDFAFE